MNKVLLWILLIFCIAVGIAFFVFIKILTIILSYVVYGSLIGLVIFLFIISMRKNKKKNNT